MNTDVQVTMFPMPSGNIRGVIIALLDGKRVAHAHILVDGEPSITLDKVSKKSIATTKDVADYAFVLTTFASEVNRNR